MFNFGVSNIRRLKDDNVFIFKKINIIVGRNSSGKSTFLRSLPLLRQSETTRTSAPILWFGDFVDFGDFKNAVSDNKINEPITFTFGLDNFTPKPMVYSRLDYNHFYRYYRYIHGSKINKIISKVDIVKFKNRTRVSKISLYIEEMNDLCEIIISDSMKVENITINGKSIIENAIEFDFSIQSDTVCPSLSMNIKKKIDLSKQDEIKNIILDQMSNRNFPEDPFYNIRDKILAVINSKINQKVSFDHKYSYSSVLSVSYPIDNEKLETLSKCFSTKSWKKLITYLSSEEGAKDLREINDLSLLVNISFITKSFSNSILEIIRSILYIGPARAKSDRYYRYQDLAVSEIDPNGTNFPMFLNSLSERQLEKFSHWVRELFGYGVNVNRESGHISINLEYDNETVNIIDTGYGVSQILPVLGQIWWSINRPNTRGNLDSSNTILAIEQPELHLHPAHQSLLADALANGINLYSNNDEKSLSYVIETHSEAMINRIGDLIFKGSLKKDDIQVLIFESDRNDPSKTKIKTATFDDEGILMDWPFGFFVPEMRK